MADMCGCEHTSHFNDTEFSPFQPEHDFMSVPAGSCIASFVGEVCDDCANGHLSDYIVNRGN